MSARAAPRGSLAPDCGGARDGLFVHEHPPLDTKKPQRLGSAATGRRPDDAPEVAAELALVVQAHARDDIARPRAVREQLLGARDAQGGRSREPW
jgi:hypothetical protein